MDLRSRYSAVSVKVLMLAGFLLTALMVITATKAAVEPGIVRIWGGTSFPSAMPAGVKAISAESNHVMVLHDDGSITAWGMFDSGIGDVPTPNIGFRAIATVGSGCLALKADGSIVTWGSWFYADSIPSVPEPNSGYVAIAGGVFHAMALRKDGSVVCWGKNDKGQCDVPADNRDFVAIDCGDEYSVALRRDGRIEVWGDNYFGQRNVPSPNSDFVQISAGIEHIMALRKDGSVVSWGANCWGQTNIPASAKTGRSVFAGGGVSSVIMQDGSITSWGYSGNHLRDIPASVKDVVLVASGGDNGYVVHADGSLQTYGRDILEELYKPKYVMISAGTSHYVALDTAGTISGWGADDQGRLTVPAPNIGYKSVSAAVDYTLAVKGDGSIVGFGAEYGTRLVPPQPNTGFVSVAAAWAHGLGLKSDGSVVAWGNNDYGQTNVPTGDYKYVQIAAGDTFSVALREAYGVIQFWGSTGTRLSNEARNKQISAGTGMFGWISGNDTFHAGGQDRLGWVDQDYFDFTKCKKVSVDSVRGGVLFDGSIKVKGNDIYTNEWHYGQVSRAPKVGYFLDIDVGNSTCMAIQRQFTMTGKIEMPDNYGCRPNRVWIHLLKPGTETIVEHIFPKCAADGSFSVPAYAVGVYDIRVSAPHMLSVRLNNVDYSTTSINVSLAGGDVDGDGQINLFDFVELDRAFGGSDESADVNNDGQVNLFDYVVLDAHFGARGQ